MPDRPSPARSMAVQAAGVPGITSDGMEWFIPAGGRDRRPLRVGDRIAPDHPLAREHADRFVPSAEPINAWPIGVASPELQKAQEAERRRLAPILGRKATPVCARCGATSAESVILMDAPGALDLNSALAGVDDGDPASFLERHRITQTMLAAARLSQARARELAEAEARWRVEHVACPPGTAPMPEPEVPANLPLSYRLPGFRNAVPVITQSFRGDTP